MPTYSDCIVSTLPGQLWAAEVEAPPLTHAEGWGDGQTDGRTADCQAFQNQKPPGSGIPVGLMGRKIRKIAGGRCPDRTHLTFPQQCILRGRQAVVSASLFNASIKCV